MSIIARYRFSLSYLCLTTLLLGCSSETASEKKGLFDEEHYVPDHWPKTVQELSTGFDLRLEQVLEPTQQSESDLNSTTNQELIDLIAWTPEITADSSLIEAQWVPIYELAEKLSRRLKNSGHSWSSDSRAMARDLSELLRSAALEGDQVEQSSNDSQFSDTNDEREVQ